MVRKYEGRTEVGQRKDRGPSLPKSCLRRDFFGQNGAKPSASARFGKISLPFAPLQSLPIKGFLIKTRDCLVPNNTPSPSKIKSSDRNFSEIKG